MVYFLFPPRNPLPAPLSSSCRDSFLLFYRYIPPLTLFLCKFLYFGNHLCIHHLLSIRGLFRNVTPILQQYLKEPLAYLFRVMAKCSAFGLLSYEDLGKMFLNLYLYYHPITNFIGIFVCTSDSGRNILYMLYEFSN